MPPQADNAAQSVEFPTSSRAPLLVALRDHVQALQAGMSDHECKECIDHVNEAWRLLDILEGRAADFVKETRAYLKWGGDNIFESEMRRRRSAALVDALDYIQRGGPADDIPF